MQHNLLRQLKISQATASPGEMPQEYGADRKSAHCVDMPSRRVTIDPQGAGFLQGRTADASPTCRIGRRCMEARFKDEGNDATRENGNVGEVGNAFSANQSRGAATICCRLRAPHPPHRRLRRDGVESDLVDAAVAHRATIGLVAAGSGHRSKGKQTRRS